MVAKVPSNGVNLTDFTISGTTPFLTIGDAGAEDAGIIFDGNAQDFYIGLDDSTDDLVIGKGSALGTTQAIAIDENMDVAIGPTSNVTITNDGNEDTLTLTSTDADATSGPILKLNRNSSSPADSDDIGKILFTGENDASESIDYATIRGDLLDVTDGTEDGVIKCEAILAGTNREMIRMGNGEGVIINEDGIAGIDFRVESDTDSHLFFVDAGNNNAYFGDNGAEASPAESSTATHTRINGVGRMQISASSAACIETNRVNSEGATINFRQAGGVRGSISVGGASTAYNTSSDYRLKENVNYTWDGTTILKQLKPAKFNWKADSDDTTVYGFIAHEAKEVVPDSVIGEKDAVDEKGEIDPQQIDQSKLVPLLVKTVQELEARIKTLEG